MMTATGMAEPAESGERRERARARRWTVYLGVLFTAGLVTGLGYAMAEDEATGAVPPWVAILACLTYAAATWFGFARLRQVSDELEVANNYGALAVAALAYLVGYPCWYALWRGGLLPEPMHEYLFVGFYVTGLAAYCWKKYR